MTELARRAGGLLAAGRRLWTAWRRPRAPATDAAGAGAARVAAASQTPPPFAPDELIARYADEPSDKSLSSAAGGERGQELLKGFVVDDDELGRGGMGRVLLVRRVSSGQLYAVKRAHPIDRLRAAFLAELWTWIDLPGHPHIVACHFFRTIEQDVAIFAEYVSGASLQKRITAGALDGVAQRLDIAIQAAWALEALHALGLVHQDVKPANLLVRDDGEVKLADFGLTAARARLPEAEGGLTANRGTEAYRSPEQAAGSKLTHSSDVWSFGVSVLEMFTGRVHACPGEIANDYLEEVVAGKHPVRCPLPDGLVHVLRTCLKVDPAQRWKTMGKAADRLKKAYTTCTASTYLRVRPPIPTTPQRRHDGTERWTGWGLKWDDPMPYLEGAIEDAGTGDAAAIARKLAAASAASLTGRALVDIAVYEEARVRYRALVQQGRAELTVTLFRICAEKAFVHAYLGDAPGAAALFAEALHYSDLIKPRTNQTVRDTAAIHINQGIVALHLEDPAAGLRAQARATGILKSLIEAGDVKESGEMLAKTYYGMAGALTHLARLPEAVPMWMHAMKFREWLLAQGLPVDQELAETYLAIAQNCAEAYPEGAIILCNKAIDLLAKAKGDNPQRVVMVAQAGIVKGRVLSSQGEYVNGAAIADEGIAQLTRVAKRRPPVREVLAEAVARRAMMAESANRRQEAMQHFDRAIALYQEVVFKDGKYELQSELDQYIERRARLAARRPA
jgi:tetratricopeptide (TPR) repeat protein